MRKQDWMTPENVIRYVERRWGKITLDACASEPNICDCFIDKQRNGLTYSWAIENDKYSKLRHTWCNPPFNNIDRWVEKAIEESRKGLTITMLLPCRCGRPWFRRCMEEGERYYHGKRISFYGASGSFLQDTMFVRFGPECEPGLEEWGVDWCKDEMFDMFFEPMLIEP